MHNWFECKVSFDKTMENGTLKKVTEPYLVDAMSFTEAEARIIEELRPYISGDFTIADIKRAKLAELFFNENGDRYFKARVNFVTLDEKSGTEKKTPANMLMQSNDLQEAKDVLTKGMEGIMADWELTKIEETKIMDVFPYEPKEKVEYIKED